MVEARRAEPRDDLMTELVQAEDEGDRLTRARASDARGRGLERRHRHDPQPAGRGRCSSSRSIPTNGPQCPSRRPDAQGVVDEAMRYSPAIFGTARTAGEDLELLGVDPRRHACQRQHGRREPRSRRCTTTPIGSTSSARAHRRTSRSAAASTTASASTSRRPSWPEALVQMRAKWPTIELAGPAPWKPVIGISGPITLPVRVSSS